MASYRGIPPRIRWGSGYVNALDIGDFDDPMTYPEPREGSDFDMAPSGTEDSWVVGDDDFLEGTVRYVPKDDALTPKRATGWNGTAGWRAALQWMRAKNVAKFHPDGRNLTVSPLMNTDGGAGIATDFTQLTSGGLVGSSIAIDGTEQAEKVIIPVGNAAKFLGVFQNVYGIIPGDVLSWSVEAKGTYTGGGRVQIYLEYRDSAGVQIVGSTISVSSQPAAYTRVSIPNRTAPATSASVHVQAYAFCPIGTDASTVFIRKAMLERATASSSTFIDNPSYDVYLTEPMKGKPDFENAKQRRLPVKFRLATNGATWDGY
jgi:hypothetical protein